jgi:hypothetical protein
LNKNILFYIPIAILIVGVFPLPIGYYTLVRLIVTAAAAYIAWQTFMQNKQSGWVWIFAFVAILFNPLMPVYLNSKPLWIMIDLATAGLFLYSSKKL